MATAASVEAVAEAAGPHLPGLMARLEARLAELASGHGDLLARHAGATIAAGGKRLRPLLVFVAAGEAGPDDAGVVRAVNEVLGKPESWFADESWMFKKTVDLVAHVENVKS